MQKGQNKCIYLSNAEVQILKLVQKSILILDVHRCECVFVCQVEISFNAFT